MTKYRKNEMKWALGCLVRPTQKGKNSLSHSSNQNGNASKDRAVRLNVLKNKSWKEHCPWPKFLYLIDLASNLYFITWGW